MNKSCAQTIKELATLKRMRELAKKSAILDGRVHILYEKQDGSYSFVPEDETFSGKLIEYIFPY